MKKSLALIVLGAALLAASGVANAEPRRAAEPSWGIRPDRTAVPSPLDLARWLARRLAGTLGDPVPVPFAPPSGPAPVPWDGSGPRDRRRGLRPAAVALPAGLRRSPLRRPVPRGGEAGGPRGHQPPPDRSTFGLVRLFDTTCPEGRRIARPTRSLRGHDYGRGTEIRWMPSRVRILESSSLSTAPMSFAAAARPTRDMA